jgi:hypothetical protein
LVNQQKKNSVKTGFEELKKKIKKIWFEKIFGDPRNVGGSDAKNESQNFFFKLCFTHQNDQGQF